MLSERLCVGKVINFAISVFKLSPVTFLMGKIMDQLYQTYQMEIRMVVLRRQVQRIAGIIAGANNSTLQL